MVIQAVSGQWFGDDSNEWWHQLLRDLRNQGRSKGMSPDAAEDHAAETCEETLRKEEKLRHRSKEDCRNYARGIGRYKYSDWYKQAARRREVPQAPESQDELGGDDGDRESFFTRRQSFLACLDAYRTEDQRWTLHHDIEAIRASAPKSIQRGIDVLRQHCVEGFSYEELAIHYHVLPETLRSLACRAAKYLRDNWDTAR